MAEIPETQDEETTDEITDGYFEEEYHVRAAEAGEFLTSLGEQLQEGDEIEVSGDGWKIPFTFDDSVEIEVQFEGSDPELEIEVELKGKTAKDETPDIE